MAEKKKGSLMSEFKAFITKGNVIDLAVAVIIWLKRKRGV